jgi:quercetin 2,3-dioxygenase
MISLRLKSTLDGADLGWLKAFHHFKVHPKGNPAHGSLGDLVVWNDDEIAAGSGFPAHSHQNLEIITYVREGRMCHRDNLGNEGTIEAGDVQIMSAGRGITHTEVSYREGASKVYQIWLLPRETDGEPQWESKQFPRGHRAGKLVALASGFADDTDAIPLRADARLLAATLQGGQTVTYELQKSRKAYLVSAVGRIALNDQLMNGGDGAAITDEKQLSIRALEAAEIIIVDVA